MKKSILFSIVIAFFVTNPVCSQSLLNRVKNSVAKGVLGNQRDGSASNASNPGPEPKCTCDQPELILDLGGKYQLDYNEITMSINDDGSILVKDKIYGKYYIVKDKVTQGPYNEGDHKLKEFDLVKEEEPGVDPWLTKFKGYITSSGNKYTITFDGKSYGPYDQISDFVVTKSKNKFAALITETLLVTEDQGNKMEEEMKKAKTDQERMDIAMKFSQEMSQKMTQGGGISATQPRLISNIPGVSYDIQKSMGGKLNSEAKYDDILLITMDKILDLQGKTVLALKQDAINANKLFVNTTGSKYAFYNYGTLTFSDNTSLSELFNPRLVKLNGNNYLAYMYYSPGKNSIMQCIIPF